MSRHLVTRFVAIGLLLILAFLQLSSLAVTSVTVDEPSHLVAGYAFLTRGDTRIRLNGPMLPNAIGAAPLLTQPNLKLTPADDPMWNANDHNGISDEFVWHNTASPFLLITLARMPFIFLSWLLGALLFRWAEERAGAWAGVFALALYVFDPNLLAHSRFVMTDFAPSALAFFALYAFDRSLRRPDSRAWLVVSGLGVGLALASKFSLTVLVIVIIVLSGLNVFATEGRRHKGFLRIAVRAAGRFACLLAVTALTVWGVYAFQIGPVNPGGLPVPAPGFWREWQSAQYYLNQPWPNYLFGQTSETGWWYYFPIAFVLKTPLPVLILFVSAFIRTVLRRTWHADLIFLLPALFLFITLLFSTNNLGYRYLLPLLPLIYVYVSSLWPNLVSRSLFRTVSLSRGQVGLLLLSGWQIIGTLHVYPYYLTYFNEITGGPDRGRYILSDSNIDWGQDMVGLKNYVDQNHIDHLRLSYFGISHPTAYGLATTALLPVRTAMNDQGAWWLKTYYPSNPPPGKYAISVANLMGGIWIDPAEYAFFRDRKPDTTIGNSIYLYTIAPRGDPANLSLAGVQIDQIDPETYRLFNTNDVRPRWFDATSSLIAASGESWIAIATNQPVAREFAALFAGLKPVKRARLTDEDRSYALYHFDLAQRLLGVAGQATQKAQGVALPAKFGDTAELLGYDVKRSDQDLTLITYWRAGEHVVTPLQMFVHVLGPDGSIAAQQDRLDAPTFGWRAGDVIAQVHRLVLPNQPSQMSFEIGLYKLDTGERLPINVGERAVGDRLLLEESQP